MRSEPVALLRRIDDRLLAQHPELYGQDPATRAITFAHGLATSPVWARLRDRAVLAVRPHPEPMVGVFGVVATEDRPLADALGWHTDTLLERLRPIGYAEAERACVVLADELRRQLGEETLAASSITGIPRGGLLVAGLLAYALGLPSERVWAQPSDGGRLLLADDCVLSGSRLGRWLDANPGPDVIAVHLASVPSCREAIVAQHPRVTACLAAVDLTDHAGDRGAGWHQRWRERSPGDLWTGDPDHVVFPWNEPESAIWNAERERAERAWRVVPPSWCLKNRAEGGDAPHEVQVDAVEVNGPDSPADDVLWAEFDDGVVVATPRDDRAIRLTGVAAVSWRELVSHGHAEAASAAVAAVYGAPEDVVRSDVARLVERLAARGLLRTR
ncbi:MAG: PqqD family peptide modification chaperone [Nitriliruptoraceae bacterium]